MENRHEKKETCKYGGIEYKAEAKVMIDIRLLGGLRQSTQKFFVINCSTVGVLLGRQGTWAINDLLNDNNKARESFVGYMDAPPPHKALLASLVSIMFYFFHYNVFAVQEESSFFQSFLPATSSIHIHVG